MNSLERAIIEKAGYANGWENVAAGHPGAVVLFSARHKAEAQIFPGVNEVSTWQVKFPKGPALSELKRSFPALATADDAFPVIGETALCKLLRRAAELAQSLPNQAAELYAEEVSKIEAAPPSATEALALVKKRIGQNLYRQALMDYWGGSCAVTGIAVPELLRASHAKPWADCATDAERLNAYNGFLLCAHLDALFDRGLLTFTDEGIAQFSPKISNAVRAALHLSGDVRLRWLSPGHLPFLKWHREQVVSR